MLGPSLVDFSDFGSDLWWQIICILGNDFRLLSLGSFNSCGNRCLFLGIFRTIATHSSFGTSGLLCMFLRTLLLLPLNSHQTEFVSFTCDIRGLFCTILRNDLTFGIAIILHQRYMTWANITAATALNTIKDFVFTCFLKILCTGEPIELLWL